MIKPNYFVTRFNSNVYSITTTRKQTNTFRKYKLNLLTLLYSHAIYTRFTKRVGLMTDTSRSCGVNRHSHPMS